MNTITLNNEIDIVFSSDDEAETGKGWYLNDYGMNATSQLFRSAEEAKAALESNEAEWS